MSEQDLEAGVAIVDIGGGTTDLALFHEGVLRYTAVIPFGGENITNDIKLGLGVLKVQAEAMKVQFGSALSDQTKSNTFITIPGLRGMAAKEISVKKLAEIIQARMSEIMDFVSYHLKQSGLDNRNLNGGIILTGGGSQLKHLLQLTEYLTGLNARIGIPNEHLSGDYNDELAMPMYSTCIGLILKGYNDFENKNMQMADNFIKLKGDETVTVEPTTLEMESQELEIPKEVVKPRRTLREFMNGFKDNLIEIFKEEEDTHLGK